MADYLVISDDTMIRVLSSSTYALINTINIGHFISCICVSPCGKKIAVSKFDSNINIYSMNGTRLQTIKTGLMCITKMAFVSEDVIAASYVNSNKIEIWDSDTCRVLEHSGKIRDFCVVRDKSLLISATSDLNIWDLETFQLSQSIYSGHNILKIVAAKDGGKIYTVGDDKAIHVWGEGREPKELINCMNQISSLHLFFDGEEMVTIESVDYLSKGIIKEWSRKGVLVRTTEFREITAPCTIANGNKLAFGDSQGHIFVVNMMTGEKFMSKEFHRPVANIAHV